MKYNELDSKFKMILDLIYNERIAQKYTQKDIAEYLNIKTNTYSLIENGKQKLLLLDLIKISRFLKLDSRISEILESNSHNSEKTENCKNDSKNDNFTEFNKLLSVLENQSNTILSQEQTIKWLREKIDFWKAKCGGELKKDVQEDISDTG